MHAAVLCSVLCCIVLYLDWTILHRNICPTSFSSYSVSSLRFYRQVRGPVSPFIKALSGLELCANVIVSAAARRSILVCGGAPPVPKSRRRRRRRGVCGPKFV